MNLVDPEGLLFGIPAGEGYGADATMYWANVYNNSTGVKAAGAAVMGSFAALWTPETSNYTAVTLAAAYLIRVVGPFPPPKFPPFVGRLRKYFRIDRPHHGKPWHIHDPWNPAFVPPVPEPDDDCQ